MPYNDLTGQASGHRTIRVALNDVVTCSADLLPGRPMRATTGCEPTGALAREGGQSRHPVIASTA